MAHIELEIHPQKPISRDAENIWADGAKMVRGNPDVRLRIASQGGARQDLYRCGTPQRWGVWFGSKRLGVVAVFDGQSQREDGRQKTGEAKHDCQCGVADLIGVRKRANAPDDCHDHDPQFAVDQSEFGQIAPNGFGNDWQCQWFNGGRKR